MSRPGNNLPGFRETQLEFAAHIRHPQQNPPPADIEPRRMQIYVDLFYNNIESLLAGSFPVAKRVLGAARWPALVRSFVHLHGSESPYFLELSQEFLAFVQGRGALECTEFLLELLHYEWVELALGVSEVELPDSGFDPAGDLLDGTVVVSPLAWRLAYRYPVHQIGPGYQPDVPPAKPTELVVYRRRDDRVRFMVVNAFTLRLLVLLEACESGRAALESLATEAGIDPQTVFKEGIETLERLRQAEILLGSIARG